MTEETAILNTKGTFTSEGLPQYLVGRRVYGISIARSSERLGVSDGIV